MIDERQKRVFAERGIVKLDGFIPESTMAPARDRVYRLLAKAGVWGDGAWLGVVDATRRPNPKLKTLKTCAKSKEFRRLLTEDVLAAARELVDGQEVQGTGPFSQLLFTPPNAERWTVPYDIWHLDFPRLGELGSPGVQMFTFLDTVASGAGGTLLVAGSHRLLNDVGALGSKAVKRRLRRQPYFRDLMDARAQDRSRFLHETGHVDDVPLQVAELIGEPGDVYFTDLRLLHSLGPNASRRPRLMVTQRLPLATATERMGAVYTELRAKRTERQK